MERAFALFSVIVMVVVIAFGTLHFNNKTDLAASASPISKPIKEDTLYEKLDKGDPVNYAVVGDSIGASTGSTKNLWHSKLNGQIKSKYGSVAFNTVQAKGGSAVYDGIIEYEELPFGQYDLFVVVFGQNDQGLLTLDEYKSAYEHLIRRIITDHPNSEIYTVVESSIKSDEYPNALREISRHYNLKVVDTAASFNASTFEYDQLTDDGVHPNDKGYDIYVNSFMEIINQNLKSNPKKELVKPLYQHEKFNLISEQKSIELTEGKSTKFSFSGETLGFTFLTGPEYGEISVYVDGKLVREINTIYPVDVDRHLIASSNLTKGKHEAEIIVTKGKAEVTAVITSVK